jgi:hypothetical protein
MAFAVASTMAGPVRMELTSCEIVEVDSGKLHAEDGLPWGQDAIPFRLD